MLELFAALLLTLPVAPVPSGTWVGYLALDDDLHAVTADVYESRFGPHVRFAFNEMDRRFTVAITSSDSVRFSVHAGALGYLEFSGTLDRNRLRGRIVGAGEGSLSLRRLDDECPCQDAWGEYVSGDDTLTVMPRPRGGVLVAGLQPGDLYLASRFPVDGRLVRLDASADVTEEIEVLRGADGGPTGLRWATAEDTTEWAKIPGRVGNRPITFRSGERTIGATLFAPSGGPATAAMAMIQGSLGGAISTRENFWQILFAREMAARGVAVLLPDKLGNGSSDGDWTLATVDDLAADALASVVALRAQVAPGARVGLAALSEGGWVLPVAENNGPDSIDFLVSVSSSALDGERTSQFEIEALAREAGLTAASLDAVRRLQTSAIAYARTRGLPEWERYLALRAELAEREELRELVAPFPRDMGDPRMLQASRRVRFDPMPFWLRVETPLLAVWGEADVRVPGPESFRVMTRTFDGREDAPPHRFELYPESGHSIDDPESGTIRSEFMDLVRAWAEGSVSR